MNQPFWRVKKKMININNIFEKKQFYTIKCKNLSFRVSKLFLFSHVTKKDNNHSIHCSNIIIIKVNIKSEENFFLEDPDEL